MAKDPSHPVYRGLSTVGAPRIARLMQRGASVLCFHNVVPTEDAGQGDRSLHMDVRDFERLVDWVSGTYRIVPLADLLERTRNRRSVRGLLALTFDDANRGFVRHGLPVLTSRGIPSTAFVVSTMATEPRPFWWDVLGQNEALSAADREAHLVRGRGMASEILGDDDAPVETVPETYLPAGWEELESALRAHPTLTVGAHTRRHPNLTRLSVVELEEELVGTRRSIAERLERSVDVVSYPYGLHDRSVREAAARAGYLAGLTLESGSWTTRTDPMRVPRLNIPATIGVSAFECWLAGLRPPGSS
ncbi:MAG: polysaccharide deacetylase family protein [Dehalococcoidia bacterium]